MFFFYRIHYLSLKLMRYSASFFICCWFLKKQKYIQPKSRSHCQKYQLQESLLMFIYKTLFLTWKAYWSNPLSIGVATKQNERLGEGRGGRPPPLEWCCYTCYNTTPIYAPHNVCTMYVSSNQLCNFVSYLQWKSSALLRIQQISWHLRLC